MTRHRHVLSGVRPLPLASYLKALGVLRLVGEQLDACARGAFLDDAFVLETEADRESLIRFFLEQVVPTPVTSPWNGGSGYYPKDNRDGFDPILRSTGSRFAAYRSCIEVSKQWVSSMGLTESPKDEAKQRLVEVCRGSWPDAAVAWIDAATVVTDERLVFPPLLGTGGNDGRLEFSTNLMKRWIELLDPNTDLALGEAESMLQLALFDENRDGLGDGSIGQFLPASSSGTNAWDFVLMIEGALVFASAAVRRMEHAARGSLSVPFTVRPTLVGYGSAASGEDSRGELWLPLWSELAGPREIGALFAEGRARVGRREAIDGLDFARAVAGLGVDRGIDAFERVGFHVRNGLSYFATPLGRFHVHRDREVDRLAELDPWLDRVGALTRSDSTPASLRSGSHELERAMFDVAKAATPEHLQRVLISAASLESEIAARPKIVDDPKSFLPSPLALSGGWLSSIDDGSVELRLALSLATTTYRLERGARKSRRIGEHIRRVARNKAGRWAYDASADPDYVWSGRRTLVDTLLDLANRIAILVRRDGDGTWSLASSYGASSDDLRAFVQGEVDDEKIRRLVPALLCVDLSAATLSEPKDEPRDFVPSLYAAFGLAHYAVNERGDSLPLAPGLLSRAASGDGVDASRLVLRRLRSSGIVPSIDVIPTRGEIARRAAAALLFPPTRRALARMRAQICRREEARDAQEPRNEGA